MAVLAPLVFLVSVVCLAVGLAKPALVLPRRFPKSRSRVALIYGSAAFVSVLLVPIDESETSETSSGPLPASEQPAATPISAPAVVPSPEREWTTCNILWAKITNADLDRDRVREARLKELSRAYDCGVRPDWLARLTEYPEVANMPEPPAPEYNVSTYRIAFLVCSDSSQVFQEAGTRDHEPAARWYSTVNVRDRAHIEGGYRGCLDVLSGAPTKHP
jgi:hypothetical protein